MHKGTNPIKDIFMEIRNMYMSYDKIKSLYKSFLYYP